MASRVTQGEQRREKLRAQRLAEAKKAKRRRITFVVIGVVVLALIITGVAILLHRKSTPTGGSAIPPDATSDHTAMLVNTSAPPSGVPTLQVTSDYQCPFCKMYDQGFEETLATATANDQVRYEIRLRTALGTALGNTWSRKANVAATCSDFAGPGVFLKFHNEIFANQPAQEGAGYSDDLLRNQIPATVGITGQALKDFQTCYDTLATAQFVDGMEKAAADLANSKPTDQDRKAWNSTPVYSMDGTNIINQIYSLATDPATGQQSAVPDPGKLKQVLGIS